MGCAVSSLTRYRIVVVDSQKPSPITPTSIDPSLSPNRSAHRKSKREARIEWEPRAPRQVSVSPIPTTRRTSTLDSGYSSSRSQHISHKKQPKDERETGRSVTTRIVTPPRYSVEHALETRDRYPSSSSTNTNPSPPLSLYLDKNVLEQDECIPESVRRLPGVLSELAEAMAAYGALVRQTRDEVLGDLTGIIEGLDPSRAKLKLQILKRGLEEVFAEKHGVVRGRFGAAVVGLSGLWGQFCGMEPAERREACERLEAGSVLMRMFDVLGDVRVGCAMQGDLDGKVMRRLEGEFEEILGLLKGMSNSGDAAMQWRVLEIIAQKRVKRVTAACSKIAERRLGVSGALLGVVEEVGEEGDSW